MAFSWETFSNRFNYAHIHEELSNSQKQAVMFLLEKKGKDERLTKTWRPIPLINVDTKIACKALAKRLEHILPGLIHYNQNKYVKLRSILDAVRTIDDVLEYTKQSGQSDILVTIDFEQSILFPGSLIPTKSPLHFKFWTIFYSMDSIL